MITKFWDAFRPQFRRINTHGSKNATNPIKWEFPYTERMILLYLGAQS